MLLRGAVSGQEFNSPHLHHLLNKLYFTLYIKANPFIWQTFFKSLFDKKDVINHRLRPFFVDGGGEYMEDVLLKRAEAIEEVKEKLEVFADIMINGYATIMERVPSFTTSILSMPEGNGSGIGLGEKVTQALEKEKNEHTFIKDYSSIISSLTEQQQQIINRKYFNNFTYREFEYGNHAIAGDKRIYEKLKDIYSLIACMDNNVAFSFDDYVEAKLEDKRNNSEKNIISKIKSDTIIILRPLIVQEKLLEENKIIDLIPEPERKLLKDYFKREKKDFSSYEYRKIARAIYTFAFLCTKIQMSEETFDKVLKRSGDGWKKYKEEVIKRSSSFPWEGGQK